VFLPRYAMLARYMLSSCVRLSVRRRYCIKTAKCRITQYTAIAERLLFSDAKNLGEISTGSPQRGHQTEVELVQTAIFGQYLAISQKRCKIGT